MATRSTARELVCETIEVAKDISPAPGFKKILVSGEPEARTRERREREGLPLPETAWQDLVTVGERFGVPLPEEAVVRQQWTD